MYINSFKLHTKFCTPAQEEDLWLSASQELLNNERVKRHLCELGWLPGKHKNQLKEYKLKIQREEILAVDT